MIRILILSMASGVEVATITMSTQLPDCNLHLTNIGKYLEIDDEVVGVKYKNAMLNVTKGKYMTTIYKKAKVKDESKINKALFYNQITLVLNNQGNQVNVKLFGNGSLHLTGCKTVDEGLEVTTLMYKKLNTLRKKRDTILLAKDVNGVLLDKDNLIYSYTDHHIIGYKKGDGTYVVHKKEYGIDNKTEMFISKKLETKRRRFVLNFDGERIGCTKIELLKNKNKFYKNNSMILYDSTTDLIYYNNDLIIGKIAYDIDATKVTDVDSVRDVLEVDYSCNPFVNAHYLLHLPTDNGTIHSNVNCINVYFNIMFHINRQRLYEKLIEMNYICKYSPETYSGIKMTFKIPIHADHVRRVGQCLCSSKCTCTNVTFLVFQSGNVIASGFKTMHQVSEATASFMKLCEQLRQTIQTRVF